MARDVISAASSNRAFTFSTAARRASSSSSLWPSALNSCAIISESCIDRICPVSTRTEPVSTPLSAKAPNDGYSLLHQSNEGGAMAIARIISREGDQQELERQYGIISGRMNELPLADGMKVHIALRTDKGMKIINVWESEQHADAAMERP